MAIIIANTETPLVVQWFGLHAFTAGATGLMPGQGTKIPPAEWCGQKKKKKKLVNTDVEHICVCMLSCIRLLVTLWTVAHQTPLSVGFSGQEYWSTGVGCHFFLQGIFPTQGSHPSLLHWQAGSLPLSHLGSP